MSGYKRVSFYDLCRLCASNTQKEKTHIFQEEGRKIQLQTKIQTCLALTVNENDFLPKVICSKCLRTLETCFGFQKECVRSESMLSTYFKNSRDTDDFKRSGKVYIKDIKPEIPTTPQDTREAPMTAPTTPQPPQNIIQISKSHPPVDPIPYYTLQLPAIVPNSNSKNPKESAENSKVPQVPPSLPSYNLNLLNATMVKNGVPKTEILSNVVVNSNGEVINISNMGDFETILSQGTSTARTKHKSSKRKESATQENASVVKIDLKETEQVNAYNMQQQNEVKCEKLPHIKSTHQSTKYSYVKTEEKNQNPTVIYPNTEYNQNINNYTSSTSGVYTQSNVVNTTAQSTQQTSSNVICNNNNLPNVDTLAIPAMRNSVVENSPMGVNNVLNQETSYRNMIALTNPTDNSDPKLISDNNLKTHVCEVCSRAFKRREHLYQHMKLHTGFRPYQCEHCNKAFMRKEHLIRHSTLHSGQKNYTCNICEKSFSRNDNLLKHKKTHDKQASYTCEICQKQFVMKHYYNAHKLTHGEKCFVSAVWNMLKT